MSYTYLISLSHEPEIGAPMRRKGDKMLYKDLKVKSPEKVNDNVEN